jgi:hypothetical protein
MKLIDSSEDVDGPVKPGHDSLGVGHSNLKFVIASGAKQSSAARFWIATALWASQ